MSPPHAAREGASIAGVDEAGRGPLAGPVVVAAVVLDPGAAIQGLADSKVLSAIQRERLDVEIRARARAYALVEICAAEIDHMNIFQATLLGMARALAALDPPPDEALIDGTHVPKHLVCAARAIVDGDALIPAISAASILAKVARDRLMVELDARHPGYGFARHKGYSTPEHLAALQRLGPCPEHRRSFGPVRALIAGDLFVDSVRAAILIDPAVPTQNQRRRNRRGT